MSRPVCSRAVFLSLLPTGLLPVKASGMVITWLVIALVSSCLPSRIAAQEADILIPPKSINVSLLGVAEFNCTGKADDFIWKINGVDVVSNGDSLIQTPTTTLNQAQGIRMSTLRVKHFSTDNTTDVTCTAVVVSPLSSDESEPALLMIQGTLDPVSDLRVTLLNSTTVNISWSPPFTLEGVPILGYIVTVITTGKKETFLVIDTVLYYLLDPDPGNFTAIVVPFNQIGVGGSAAVPYAFNDLSTDSFTLAATQVTVVSYITTTITTASAPPTGQEPANVIIAGGSVGAILLLCIILCAAILVPCAVHKLKTKKKDNGAETECLARNHEPPKYKRWEMDQATAYIKLKFRNPGDFLVRYSSEQQKHVLSVKWKGSQSVMHIKIYKRFHNPMHPEKVYYIGVLDDVEFNSIDELIEHLVKYKKKIAPSSTAVLLNHISLIDEWTISYDDIKDMELISTNGYFGIVYKASWNNKEVAVKTCKPSISKSDRHQFLHGIEILKQCEHDNIVKVFGVAEKEGTIYSVKEMMSGGTLAKFLREKNPNSCKERQLTEMCIQVCCGMAYLEKNNHIHCVLGARNCLISGEDHNIIVKVNNIGLIPETAGIYQAGYLTPAKWTAPEALRDHRYTSASDVWSFGVLLWETFSFGAKPYPKMLQEYHVLEWVEAAAENRMSRPKGCPESVYKVMKECWQYDKKKRPTFAELGTKLNELYSSMK